jgi:hypothetical protein
VPGGLHPWGACARVVPPCGRDRGRDCALGRPLEVGTAAAPEGRSAAPDVACARCRTGSESRYSSLRRSTGFWVSTQGLLGSGEWAGAATIVRVLRGRGLLRYRMRFTLPAQSAARFTRRPMACARWWDGCWERGAHWTVAAFGARAGGAGCGPFLSRAVRGTLRVPGASIRRGDRDGGGDVGRSSTVGGPASGFDRATRPLAKVCRRLLWAM